MEMLKGLYNKVVSKIKDTSKNTDIISNYNIKITSKYIRDIQRYISKEAVIINIEEEELYRRYKRYNKGLSDSGLNVYFEHDKKNTLHFIGSCKELDSKDNEDVKSIGITFMIEYTCLDWLEKQYSITQYCRINIGYTNGYKICKVIRKRDIQNWESIALDEGVYLVSKDIKTYK